MILSSNIGYVLILQYKPEPTKTKHPNDSAAISSIHARCCFAMQSQLKCTGYTTLHLHRPSHATLTHMHTHICPAAAQCFTTLERRNSSTSLLSIASTAGSSFFSSSTGAAGSSLPPYPTADRTVCSICPTSPLA